MSLRGLVKKFIPRNLFKKVEPAGHLSEAIAINALNGFPARGLKVIGVTGTNGKTSTSFLIHRMLHEAGYTVGLMTTVAYGVGNDIKPQMAHMTSVGPAELMRRIKEMKAQGMEWLVLETTSHALAQHRVWGIPYSIAVLTNLTHEHLDYHGTFENYRDAKAMMFRYLRKAHGKALAIVNADDSNADYFAEAAKPVPTYRYSLSHGDLTAVNIQSQPSGSDFGAEINGKVQQFHVNLPGSFNVANALAAISVGVALELDPEVIAKGIAALKDVEGRMERVDEGQDFDVIVDYAHTPDSFEKLFKDLKPMVKGKLIVLFGSAGRRDEAKRAVQGKLAGEYADEVIVTEEDDRDIDGQEIMNQIAAGAESAGKMRDKDLFLVHDRTEAIQFAVNRATSNDTVLLLGKGHEKDILRNGPKAAELRHLQQDDHNAERVVEFPWDEVATAHQALRNKH